MELFNKFRFHWVSDVGMVKDFINRWCPENCHKEKDFENSLYHFLSEQLEGFSIIQQYGIRRTRADLVVQDSLAIELKHGLTSKSELQRLIGQLVEYEYWKGRLLIVIIGQHDQNLLAALRRQVDSINQGAKTMFVDPDKIVVIIKPIPVGK